MTEENKHVEESTVTEETAVEETVVESEEETVDETIEQTETDAKKDELAELKAANAALEDRALRLQAEISNMQRTNARDRQNAAKYRSQSLATNLLEVVDNFERALTTEVTSDDALTLKKGIEMVHGQLLSALEREKVTMIDPLNEPFDPNFHQAVSTMPAEEGQATDVVVNVLQKGYQLDDRVIRPAMVIVSA
ncbi:nucleotide exchange factor GrpE [Fundicoccus ignavus]|uniref:Protein GrpE n=1 Tax=Fundicoccus ignavus TaxID=2664442 RepID=A0A6I2GHC6_9LACT|nr:nucleotide exchange factor GrpE [Fundicoccus ignavus]MRI82654.1 nucleotide exchange factor GrpE [Fundicoccus ignavus]MRI84659.1 nucleotide exchange factor GrpE [Fundicoccus ignavus]MRJ48345.1 nucleotide exchange factor GrpE [Fundicoccus ignavus]